MTEPNPTNVPADWTMPEDLERFRDLLVNTGGNTPEDLINDLNRNTHLMSTNVVRFVLAVSAQSQMGLLRRLATEGHLKPTEPENATPGTGQVGLCFPGVEAVHDVSDGYHTFGELYDHRRALCVALARVAVLAGGETAAYRTKAHHPDDDPMFPGYFLVAFRTLQGAVTYHYKLQHWDEFEGVPEREHAEPYDGHTPADTLGRLQAWLAPPIL